MIFVQIECRRKRLNAILFVNLNFVGTTNQAFKHYIGLLRRLFLFPQFIGGNTKALEECPARGYCVRPIPELLVLITQYARPSTGAPGYQTVE